MKNPVCALIVVFLLAIPAAAQDPGWIGVTVADRPEGVVVQSVQPDSPAATAGVQANDVLIQFNGQSVVGVLQLTRLVQETPVGRTVSVRVRRGGDERTFQVTTAGSPGFIVGAGKRIQLPDLSNLRVRVPEVGRLQIGPFGGQIAGVSVQAMTPQLREFFGVAGEGGVLVSSVEAGSAAAMAGIQAGDVVLSVAGITVSSPAEFTSRMRSSGATMILSIVREKQQREITLQGVTRGE